MRNTNVDPSDTDSAIPDPVTRAKIARKHSKEQLDDLAGLFDRMTEHSQRQDERMKHWLEYSKDWMREYKEMSGS